MLALNKKVGLLSIQSPRLWKVLYFDPRGVTLYFNPHTLLDRAIATFVRVGRVQASAVDELRDHSSRNQMSLLDSSAFLSLRETMYATCSLEGENVGAETSASW